jgi:hypothetical protein
MFHDDENSTRASLLAVAHVEWHQATGAPLGADHCPFDACHDAGADNYIERDPGPGWLGQIDGGPGITPARLSEDEFAEMILGEDEPDAPPYDPDNVVCLLAFRARRIRLMRPYNGAA